MATHLVAMKFLLMTAVMSLTASVLDASQNGRWTSQSGGRPRVGQDRNCCPSTNHRTSATGVLAFSRAKTVQKIAEGQETVVENDTETKRTYESDIVDAQTASNPIRSGAKWVREGISRLKVGTTGLWTNYQTCRDIRARVKNGHDITYSEFAHLQRGKQDRGKILNFVVIWVALPEVFPLLLSFSPALIPSTFERPDEVDAKYHRFSLSRVRATVAGLTQLEEELTKNKQKRQATAREYKEQAQCILEARSKRDIFERYHEHMIAPAPRSKQDEKRAKLRVALGIPPPVIKGLGKGMGLSLPFAPAFYIRPKLRQHVQELGDADAVLRKRSLDVLSEAELHEACNARGMDVAGKDPERLRASLDEWLQLTSTAPREPGEGMVFVSDRARLLCLGLNYIATARVGQQASLTRKALLGSW